MVGGCDDSHAGKQDSSRRVRRRSDLFIHSFIHIYIFVDSKEDAGFIMIKPKCRYSDIFFNLSRSFTLKKLNEDGQIYLNISLFFMDWLLIYIMGFYGSVHKWGNCLICNLVTASVRQWNMAGSVCFSLARDWLINHIMHLLCKYKSEQHVAMLGKEIKPSEFLPVRKNRDIQPNQSEEQWNTYQLPERAKSL